MTGRVNRKHAGQKRNKNTKSVTLGEMKTIKKQVKHLVALEKGATIYDEFPTNAVLASAGTVLYLNPTLTTRFVDEPQIVAGEKSIKAFFKSLTFSFRPYQSALSFTSTVPDDIVIRCIIFQDWANKGALPAVTDVLVASTPESPYNKLNSKRFSIKHDKCYLLTWRVGAYNGGAFGSTGVTEVLGIQQKPYKKTIKLAKNKAVEYIGTAGTVADAQKGQLFMLTLQDAGSITSNGGVADYFYDSQLTCEFI